MASAAVNLASPAEYPGLPASYSEPHWYAAYTSAHHEKHVAAELEARAVEHFLPVYGSVRRWKDRRVRLLMPLFPGYVFVHIALRDRLQVLAIPSVVHLVGSSGTPSPLPTQEIETLRSGMAIQLCAVPHPYLTVGRRARITAGPLAGLQGILLRRKGNFRVVLSIHLIQRSIIVDVDAAILELLPRAARTSGIDTGTING